LLEGCDRFDPRANDVFNAGETTGGNLGLGRARDVFWKVGGFDVSCHFARVILSERRAQTTGASGRAPLPGARAEASPSDSSNWRLARPMEA
jgi:hypothetical protein